VKLLLFFLLWLPCLANASSQSFKSYFEDFKEAVIEEFTHKKQSNKNKIQNNFLEEDLVSAQNVAKGYGFDFFSKLYNDYVVFSQDRQLSNDPVDSFYFLQKANKFKNNKNISPANPIEFGIVAEDIEQFLDARKRLIAVSLPAIITSSDGLILSDAYIAFDCWLEAFEEVSNKRAAKCRDRFIDDIRALELSLLNKGLSYSSNFGQNPRYDSCATCRLFANGSYCNAVYFNNISLMRDSHIALKRLLIKMATAINPVIVIANYSIAKQDRNMVNARLQAVRNIVQSQILTHKDDNFLPFNPEIKFTQIETDINNYNKSIFQDMVLICIREVASL
jgi:hypothetical protein